MEHAVDHGARVAADFDYQPSRRQFPLPKMDQATLAYSHRRRPDEAEFCHIILEPFALHANAVICCLFSGQPFRSAPCDTLSEVTMRQARVQVRVGESGDNGNGAANAISSFAAETSGGAPAISDNDFHEC
jgi:hypothetical protein